MYADRAGIWGHIPQANNFVDTAMGVASGLGKIQQTQLQNTGLGLTNEAFPENQAMKLAAAIRLQEQLDLHNRMLQQSKDRFNSDIYNFKQYNQSLVGPVRGIYQSQHGPEIDALGRRVLNNAVNGQPQSSTQNYQYQPGSASSVGLSVLQPYLDKRGIGYQSQNQPSYSLGQQQPPTQPYVQQPQYGIGQQTVPPNQSGITQSTSPVTQTENGQAIADAAKAYTEKNVRTSGEVNRVDAGDRYETLVGSLLKYFPAAVKYAGPAGQIKLGEDTTKASLPGKFKEITPDYQAYLNYQKALNTMKADLGPMLGKQSTDQAVKDTGQLLDVIGLSGGPTTATETLYRELDNLKKTIDTNKSPVSGRLKDKNSSSDPVFTPKEGWIGNHTYYNAKEDKYYSRDEMHGIHKKGLK